MSSSPTKQCFFNPARPCDLTCKAAFEVDDPVDNIDCSFVWFTFHAGEALFELRQVLENMRGMQSGGTGPKPPKSGPYSGSGGPSSPKTPNPPHDN
jgi:hypothetical protein